jgi:hypothetical protein
MLLVQSERLERRSERSRNQARSNSAGLAPPALSLRTRSGIFVASPAGVAHFVEERW